MQSLNTQSAFLFVSNICADIFMEVTSPQETPSALLVCCVTAPHEMFSQCRKKKEVILVRGHGLCALAPSQWTESVTTLEMLYQ